MFRQALAYLNTWCHCAPIRLGFLSTRNLSAGNGDEVDDGHLGREVPQVRVADLAAVPVPPSPFDVHAVHVGPLLRLRLRLLPVHLGRVCPSTTVNRLEDVQDRARKLPCLLS
jgi:hypothetical protein